MAKLQAYKELKNKADDAYFNSGNPIMSDEAYDGLCNQLNTFNLEELKDVGCLPKNGKIKLPVYMGSLTKHNDNKTIKNFLDKFDHTEYLVQEKLDGVSCLYAYYCETTPRLFTRGNGTIGTDITHLITCGLKLPIVKVSENFMIRGELIMSKATFKDKYASTFKNIRNMISGQISTKIPESSIIKDIDFVAYELIIEKKFQKSILKQYQFLKELDFKVVYHRVFSSSLIEQQILMDYLKRRKNKGEYEIDGLVISTLQKYVRNDSDNPKYSFAFKIQGDTAEVQVKEVKWNLSKSGKYKPQIFIEPVRLCGVTISSLTGFNAKYVVDNGIVEGTTLLITRSGDVIPHIITVLNNDEKNKTVTLPPNSKWRSVDLYHNFDQTPDEVIIKQMVYFFTSLKCLNCKDKTIIKIYQSGYKTIESIIEAKPEDLSLCLGQKVATKLLLSIKNNIKAATIHELMAALNCFGEGIGLKKIQNIDINNPERNVPGLSATTINTKILPVWELSLNRVKNIKKLVGIQDAENQWSKEPEADKSKNNGYSPFTNKIFVFTGFRDAALEKQISNLGGRVSSAISNKTTDLVVADSTTLNSMKSSTKLIKAKTLGINITIKSDLLKEISVQRTNPCNSCLEVEYDNYSSSEEE
jgi:NAD-dependent DNA ligase